ncbi:MAG: M1 family metallopeptidase [Bacteroidota bacterium]
MDKQLKSIATLILFLFAGGVSVVWGQENINLNKFRQLKQELPTPNVYRNAAGAPGHEYWQQKADYVMDITLDDENQRIYGEETITYHNYSPDVLTYLWLQLDQNMRAEDSDTKKIKTGSLSDQVSFSQLKGLHSSFDGGFKLDYVKDTDGNPLSIAINKTMMRVDLPKPLKQGDSFSFQVKWWYNINDRIKYGGRSGMEYFAEDDNYVYTIAQFFPRMCVYNEVEGWQNKQFLGRGEFTLPFGDYKVSLTVPEDHVVGSTGVLQNPKAVLSAEQRERWEKAQTEYETPVLIVTEEEAREAEKTKKLDKTKTWVFEAENVRDFAFATSRKFIWDAMAVRQSSKNTIAASFYPKEGNPLWEKYSTRSVAHTLEVYSKYTFDYPYPIAISVHTDRIGMEYPMICFNGRRPLPDGTYSSATKYGLISVIIHEVGHNYFPMIVNSDERQWTWMDEGLNSFLQYLAEQEWERDYPSRRGPAYKIADYMKGDKSNITPIMTNSESIFQFGNNAYGKPATALNILRETVMGRELFDYAFKEYSQRWMFKHPTPADLFRTMEDASGVDLDWFWRGWFYTTDHVDMAIKDVQWFQVNSYNPEVEKPLAKAQEESAPVYIGDSRNKETIKETVTERDPRMKDFYNEYDPFEVSLLDKAEYAQLIESLPEDERALLESNYNYYSVTFENKGGLVMPVILKFEYEDGTSEVQHIPAEIWRLNAEEVSKIFKTEKVVKEITLDPFLETADTDTGNNYWPPKETPTRFDIFRNRDRYGQENNKMRRAQYNEELKKQMESAGQEQDTNQRPE